MQKERFLKRIGSRIIELRLKKGWSQRDLAFECGKEPQSIERVENGKTNPTIFYLKEVADALGVKLSSLLD